jgi:hypothetical protein
MSSIRADLPVFQLNGAANAFDRGGEVEVAIPASWNLEKGDLFSCRTTKECFAEVISVGEKQGNEQSVTIKQY